MKRFLKFLGIILLLAIAFILISGLFISKDYHFERSIRIAASKEEVWKNVSLFSNFEKWDPWAAKDKGMTRTISGTDGAVGATYTWKGNKDVGSGSQTFKELKSFESIVIDLRFKEPFESKAIVRYHFAAEGMGTKVTWSFDSKMPYPFNAVCFYFIDIETSMDKDFSAGLANLKKLCENSVTLTAMNHIRQEQARNEGQAQLLESTVKK